MGRTSLFYNRQSGGMFSIEDTARTTGDRWYVDSGSAYATNATGYGKNPDNPFATIDYAIGQCTANNGDIIYVMPGHAETVSAAGGITCDTAGITILGLGEGGDRPTITLSATASTILVTAATVTIENLILVAEAAVVSTIVISAANCRIANCLFLGGAAGETHKIPIITAAGANDLIVEDNRIQLLVADDGTTAITTTSSEAIRLVGADRAIVRRNYLSGDFTTSAINGVTTASLDIQILDNVINNVATENIAGVIDLVAGCSGFIDGNKGYTAYSVATGLIDDSSCIVGLNYVNNATSEAMALWAQSETSDAVVSVGVLVSTATSTVKSANTIVTSKINSLATSLATKLSAIDSQVS